jgi:hypothetical protein
MLPLSNRVAAVEFRYHDGSQWLESWDSAAQAALPLAIEVAVLVLNDAEMGQESVAGTTAMFAGIGSSAAPETDSSATAPVGRIYRRVIHLPLSGLSPTSASELDAAAEKDDSAESNSSSGSGSGTGAPGSGRSGRSGGSGGTPKSGSGNQGNPSGQNSGQGKTR